MERMLTTEETARRLGVKVPTVYAYVSRGLLRSHPDPASRGSLFDLAEVESLAARSRGGRRTVSRLATVTTGVTRLDARIGPLYRGRAVTELAGAASYEEVAELLWSAGDRGTERGVALGWRPPDLPPCPLEVAFDRMRYALVLCGASDPLRADARPPAVRRAARRSAAALVAAAGPPPAWDDADASMAERLSARLLPGVGSPALPTAAVDAALVLMADHELATSTLAARLAASTRADLYDALLAAVATLAGPLHGGATQRAHELLVVAQRDGVPRALNDTLREQGRLPGFGHAVYPEGDPRFAALLAVVEPSLPAECRDLVHEVLEVAAAADVAHPNCDLALATLSWGTGMPPDAGRMLFAVARVAGWTAHYLEELGEAPLRFRARAVYAA